MGNVRRLIVFDLDGTLIDSRRDLADSANQLIGELGGTLLSEPAIGAMVGDGAAALVRRALAAAGVEHTPAGLPRFLEIYDSRLLNHTRAYDGIPEAVRAARVPHVRSVVLTNKPARPSERILAGLGMRDLFDEVVGGDGPNPRKPDPASLLQLMDRGNVTAANTLVVGDSAIDHETARRGSVRCCLATYGFGYANFPADRLSGDEWFAADGAELEQVLRAFIGQQ